MIRITIFCERVQERGAAAVNLLGEYSTASEKRLDELKKMLDQSAAEIRAVYPEGIYGALKAFLEKEEDFTVRFASMEMPEHGLSEEVLDDTDVLMWWSHMANETFSDEVAQRVCHHVQQGMGFIPLHSAHLCKPLKLLLGTTQTLGWRHDDFCRVWNIVPSHPIAAGIPQYFELEQEEMYSEPFDIPTPDELLFISWFGGGEVFRGGCTWRRGYGRIFYFHPGHETNRAYYNPHVQRIIVNAVRWACPDLRRERIWCPEITVSPEQRRLMQ